MDLVAYVSDADEDELSLSLSNPRDRHQSRISLPNNFNNTIRHLEKKYQGSENLTDCLVNLHGLQVVNQMHNSPQVNHRSSSSNSKQQVTRRKTEYQIDFDQSINSNCSEDNRQNQSITFAGVMKSQALPPPATTVVLSEPQTQVTYFKPNDATPQQSLVTYEPSFASKVFDTAYQQLCLVEVRKVLSKNDEASSVLRRHMQEQVLKTIGLNVLPQPGSASLMPFVHCDDNGDFHISFIYDSPPFTPWKCIVRETFGEFFCNLQKQVYELICKPSPEPNLYQQKALDYKQFVNRLQKGAFATDTDSESAFSSDLESPNMSVSFPATNVRPMRTIQELQAPIPSLQPRSSSRLNSKQKNQKSNTAGPQQKKRQSAASAKKAVNGRHQEAIQEQQASTPIQTRSSSRLRNSKPLAQKDNVEPPRKKRRAAVSHKLIKTI